MKRTLLILAAIALLAQSCKKCYTCKAAIYNNGERYGTAYASPNVFPDGEADYHDVCGKDKNEWDGKISYDDSIGTIHYQLIYECLDK